MKDCGREREITGEGEGDAKTCSNLITQRAPCKLTGLRGFLQWTRLNAGLLGSLREEILTVTSQVREKEKHPQQIVPVGHSVGSPSPQKNVQKMSFLKKS